MLRDYRDFMKSVILVLYFCIYSEFGVIAVKIAISAFRSETFYACGVSETCISNQAKSARIIGTISVDDKGGHLTTPDHSP